MEVLALGGEEAERGFPGLPWRRSERWRRRRPSGGVQKKKCEPCAAGRAVGLQSTFLASQPLLVLVPVAVDIKQAINGNNLAKWACAGISEQGFPYQLCTADSHGKLKDRVMLTGQYTRRDAFSTWKYKVNQFKCTTNTTLTTCPPANLNGKLREIEAIRANNCFPTGVLKVVENTNARKHPPVMIESNLCPVYLNVPLKGVYASKQMDTFVHCVDSRAYSACKVNPAFSTKLNSIQLGRLKIISHSTEFKCHLQHPVPMWTSVCRQNHSAIGHEDPAACSMFLADKERDIPSAIEPHFVQNFECYNFTRLWELHNHMQKGSDLKKVHVLEAMYKETNQPFAYEWSMWNAWTSSSLVVILDSVRFSIHPHTHHSQSLRIHNDSLSNSLCTIVCRIDLFVMILTRSLVAVEPRRPPMTDVGTETAFRLDQRKHFRKSKHLLRSEVNWCDQTSIELHLRRSTSTGE